MVLYSKVMKVVLIVKQYYNHDNTCITFDPAVRIISGLIFWGGLISRVVLFLGWSYFWSGLISGVVFFWSGLFSGVVVFLGWSYFWGGLISGMA